MKKSYRTISHETAIFFIVLIIAIFFLCFGFYGGYDQGKQDAYKEIETMLHYRETFNCDSSVEKLNKSIEETVKYLKNE